MPTRTDRALESYYPALHFSKMVEYSLEEVQTEQEAFQKLDELILKADANVARLAETYRERAMTPGQIRDYRDAQEAIKTYATQLDQSQKARDSFAATPARRFLSEYQKLKSEAPAKATPSAMAQKVIDQARKIANPALQAKFVRDAARVIPFNATEKATIAGSLTGDRTFSKLIGVVDSPEGQRSIQSYRSGVGEVPPELRQAASLIETVESPYAHGRKGSTMAPTQEALRDQYVRSLQKNGGRINPDDFTSMEEMEAAEEAYLQARTDQNYASADAEWYAEDYLRAFQTRQDLVRQKEAGLGYDDPWKEAQKRAFERGGYDLKGMYLAAADPKKHDLINRSFGILESMRSGDFKGSKLTKRVAELYRQSKAQGITLTQDMLKDELAKFYRDEATAYRRTATDARRERRQDVRELRKVEDPTARRKAIRARRDAAEDTIYDAETRKIDMTDRKMAGAFLAALKLSEKIPADEPMDKIQLPYKGPAPMDDSQQAAKEEARIKREAQEQLQKAPSQAPVPPAPASEPPTPVSEFRETTGPFTDPTDPSSVYEYDPSSKTYVALQGPYAGREFLSTSTAGMALQLAEKAAKGDNQSLAQLEELQDRVIRQAATRGRNAPVAEIDLSGGGVVDPAKLQAQEAIKARRAELMAQPAPAVTPEPTPTPVSNPPAEVDDEAFLRGVLEEGQ